MSGEGPMIALVWAGLFCPAALVAVLFAVTATGRRLPESVVGALTGLAMASAALLFGLALTLRLLDPSTPVLLDFGDWFSAGDGAFSVRLLADEMSLAFAVGTSLTCGVVSAFSRRYLHKEPGYHRYFTLFAVFATGTLMVVLAGTVEVLFAGWELLGLSSALLVGFFHERSAPLDNAMRVFAVYRISDAAMLSAAVLAHHFLGRGGLMASVVDPGGGGLAGLSPAAATAIAGLLVVAAAGKCAQLPLSGWLPRAMEGPTPSSAVYYGALSVHAGAYLLLRASPVLEQAPLVRGLLVAMGAFSALYATLVGRVQTDIKSALAFASLTQVSLILVEIGLGWYRLAVLHIAGHACLRLLQFLRAPSVLHDHHLAESAFGGHFAPSGSHLERLVPAGARSWLYRFALERAYVDAGIERVVVGPVLRGAAWLDACEHRLCDRVAGRAARSGSDEPRGNGDA